MDKAKQNFAKRLKEAMEAAGYEARPAVLEKNFNLHYRGDKPMTLQGVRRWLMGETFPSQDKLIAIAEWLRVPPEQLRYGAEIKNEIQQARQRWDDAISYRDREIFEAYLALLPAQRKIVSEVIMTFFKLQKTQETPTAEA